jgi:hypothetical protein
MALQRTRWRGPLNSVVRRRGAMGSLVAFYEAVADEWRARGVPVMPGAPEDLIIGLFAELGCPLSGDVRDLYSTVGGFSDYECDRLWSFWSPGRVRAESGGSRRPFVMFADWLINSHLYCFRYESPEVSSVYITHDGWSLEPEPVAVSVADFFKRLLTDPNSVGAWDLEAERDTAADPGHGPRFL